MTTHEYGQCGEEFETDGSGLWECECCGGLYDLDLEEADW